MCPYHCPLAVLCVPVTSYFTGHTTDKVSSLLFCLTLMELHGEMCATVGAHDGTNEPLPDGNKGALHLYFTDQCGILFVFVFVQKL